MKVFSLFRLGGLIGIIAVAFMLCTGSGCKSSGFLPPDKDVSAHNSMSFPVWE